MTEEGRRLTIERIDEYKKEGGEKEKEIKQNSFLTAVLAALAFSGVVRNFIDFDNSTSELLSMIISSKTMVGLFAGGSVYNLLQTFKAISRKTGIEINIENLEAQLKEDEFEREEKGKNR